MVETPKCGCGKQVKKDGLCARHLAERAKANNTITKKHRKSLRKGLEQL